MKDVWKYVTNKHGLPYATIIGEMLMPELHAGKLDIHDSVSSNMKQDNSLLVDSMLLHITFLKLEILHISFAIIACPCKLVLINTFSPQDSIAYGNARYGQGTGNILLDNVACTGVETRLIDCPHIGEGVHNCIHSEDASVRCVQNRK